MQQVSLNTIVRNLFQRDSLEEVQEDQLADYVKQYPYSSIGHLLLTKKKKQLGNDYSHEAAITSLYINNPLWLHSFLDDQPTADIIGSTSLEKEQSLAAPPTVESPETSEAPIAEISPEITTEAEPNEVTQDAPGTDEEAVPDQAASTNTGPLPENTVMVPAGYTNEQPGQVVQVEEGLVFEPYHTIDYFASQGIKLKAEDLAKDKFGRQLKSFTDWLRSMKKIGPVQTGQTPANEASDAKIVQNAEESIENSEVETEAMAEVWIKQGKPTRAVAIYHKLSLLNPSKSDYFAAKIEQLNA